MKEEKNYVHVQELWFKSLDLKTTSPEKVTIMEFPENFLCSPKGPESPNLKIWKVQLYKATNDRSSQREKDECVFHSATDGSIVFSCWWISINHRSIRCFEGQM